MADDIRERLAKCTGFEWDDGNPDKSWLRHEVSQAEAEQALLNIPLVIRATVTQQVYARTTRGAEPRFIALGQTDAGRLLAVVFTVRGTLARVISARAMSKAERRAYGHVEADTEGDSGVPE